MTRTMIASLLAVGVMALLVSPTRAFAPVHKSPPIKTTRLPMTRLCQECETLINRQITRELEASQLYLAASIWCEAQNLVGMAQYMLSESQEERSHALAIIDFATKRDVTIQLEAIAAPLAASQWQNGMDGCLAVWESLLESEKANTQSLFQLADAAVDSRDHALTAFLMPYHQEQVTSEDQIETIISKVRDESKTPGLIRQLDTELGAAGSA